MLDAGALYAAAMVATISETVASAPDVKYSLGDSPLPLFVTLTPWASLDGVMYGHGV